MGWVKERITARGVTVYLSNWRVDGKVRAKQFLIREEAEDWLRTLWRLRAPVTAEQRRATYDSNVVYFIQGVDGGPIKIGHARNPADRLKAMQLGSPVQLRIIAIVDGGIQREAELHQRFQHVQTHGEWFHPDEALMAWIAEHATAML